MKYPLKERIGKPELLVGRKKEFAYFEKWLNNIPEELSQSIAILARKKSGKTALVQRIFNQLWNAGDDVLPDPNAIPVIPFYLEIPDKKVWYPNFAMDYYRQFATQYISYLERDESLIRRPMKLEQIKQYGEDRGIIALVDDVESLIDDQEKGSHDLMWETAYMAPHRYASVYNQRIVVMIDEFQNINRYVYLDETCEKSHDETMEGSYSEVAESKIAPMLVVNSGIKWPIRKVFNYQKSGNFAFRDLSPHLTEEEGLEAVYQYAKLYREPITNLTAATINELCMADPFFIACVIQSNYPERDLTTKEGVVATVNYEVSNRKSQLAKTWAEYINNALDRINGRNGKKILLHLSKHADRPWTHLELKKELDLDPEPKEILRKLMDLVDADLIEEGVSDIAFQGLQDGTLYLILRNRFEEEISSFPVDLKKDLGEKYDQMVKKIRSLRGKVNHLSGKLAEEMFATELRSKKRIKASDYFSFSEVQENNGNETTTKKTADHNVQLNLIDVRTRQFIQRPDGKNMELDIIAHSDCGRTVLIEMKKRKEETSPQIVTDFKEKVEHYKELHPDRTVIAAFFSKGGFKEKAKQLCKTEGIGIATEFDIFENL